MFEFDSDLISFLKTVLVVTRVHVKSFAKKGILWYFEGQNHIMSRTVHPETPPIDFSQTIYPYGATHKKSGRKYFFFVEKFHFEKNPRDFGGNPLVKPNKFGNFA